MMLARLSRSGDLTAVRVPGAGDEAVRDLVRACEDAVRECRNARHRGRAGEARDEAGGPRREPNDTCNPHVALLHAASTRDGTTPSLLRNKFIHRRGTE